MQGVVSIQDSPGGADRLTSYLGMVVALASWIMLFAALFLAYVLLRIQQPMWPPLGTPPLPVGLASWNTGVLLASSVAVGWAGHRLGRGDRAAFLRWLLAAIGLGGLFFALQVRLWQTTHASGLGLAGILGSVFYTLTWLHAAHIVAGLAALVWLFVRASRSSDPAKFQSAALVVPMFWHFLDVIWLCMFVGIFLV